MLRKILLSSVVIFGAVGAASAADLPTTKGPPIYTPPPPPIFTWTGLYIGGQVGYQWGTSDSYVTSGADAASVSPSGVDGGGHVGYNYQIGQFVAGIEGDVNGTSYNGTVVSPLGNSFRTKEYVDGSVRGRLGVAFDRALIYGTGGVAFGDFSNSYLTPFGYDNPSSTRVGWTVGGGIEYAIDPSWSIRAEYRYTDYGHFDQYSPIAFGSNVDEHETDNRVQVGFSYKFDLGGPGPVVAKY